MVTIGSRRRSQPPPPWVVYEALTDPLRAGGREWLFLRADEDVPEILEAEAPRHVVWSSLWPSRPDARIAFDIVQDSRSDGTDLGWTLTVEEPEPEPRLVGHFRKRLNELINRDLRYSFGQ